MTTELELEASKTEEPHPLKGIINTNDDPFECALCHTSPFISLESDTYHLRACCGKGLCASCACDDKLVSGCLFCPILCGSQKDIVKILKKNAKKGHPWAYHALGDCYYFGRGARRALSEAFRWCDMAAERGHPTALENIGMLYLQGEAIVAVDLHKAQKCFEAALSALPCLDNCRRGLLEIAKEYQRVNTDESTAEAKAILLAITKDPPSDPNVFDLSEAFYRLGLVHFGHGNDIDAYKAYVISMTCAGDKKYMEEAAYFAMLCAEDLGWQAQARFWFNKIKLSEIIDNDLRRNVAEDYFRLAPIFRDMRDSCGGCGAEFDGKERKYCRECRTFCYCSRECQKLHWNCKKDGHRKDCLGMKEWKKQLIKVEFESRGK